MKVLKDLKIHCIPVGGFEHLHKATMECSCHPLEIYPNTIAHNAFDCREKYERQGYRVEGCFWVHIAEKL